jgi:hypothetical protein
MQFLILDGGLEGRSTAMGGIHRGLLITMAGDHQQPGTHLTEQHCAFAVPGLTTVTGVSVTADRSPAA